MFIFSFQRPNYAIIQHIVISGQTVSLFINKPDEQDFPEIFALTEELKLTVIQPDFQPVLHDIGHSEHENLFLQTPVKDGERPHQHYLFRGDPQRFLATFLNQLVKLQVNIEKRKKELEEYTKRIDDMRVAARHEELPEYIKIVIENFNTEKPLVPAEEVPTLLKEFQLYQEKNHIMRHADDVAKKMLHASTHASTYASVDILNKYRNALIKYGMTKRAQDLIEAKDLKPDELDLPEMELGQRETVENLKQECERYSKYLATRLQSYNPQTDQYRMTNEKINKVKALQDALSMSASPAEAITTFSQQFFKQGTYQPVDELFKANNAFDNNFLITIGVILSGILPGLVVLMAYSLHKNNSISFWKSSDVFFREAVLNDMNVLPEAPESVIRNF